ncbi:7TM diverse intracellular signaling domain-containing protein [Pseudotenacibaculum sp. MALMAid0570]|uniref:7TM diverse intracellular signaling domain-containing protein n=1 Tax=Pseudotenacibaculum sp. MALMAid0570 TaxID=3143938 RepID=UPI0032DE6C62
MSLESCKEKIKLPQVNKGYLDLTNWDFTREKIIRLDGSWEFYWKQIPFKNKGEVTFSPLQNKEYINIPNTWNQKGYSAKGYATFRVKILLPVNRPKLKIKIPRINFAGKVIINKEVVFSMGEFSTNEGQNISYGKTSYIELSRVGDEIDLIILVSNFSHRNGGGFTQGVILGTDARIEQKRNLSIIIQASSSFFIIVICLYQIFIFVTHRREVLFLYFGAFCLIASVRQLFVGEVLIYEFFSQISYSNIIIWRNIPLSVGLIFFLLYYKELYPKDSKEWFFKLIFIICVLSFLFVIVSPTFLKTQARLVNRYLSVSVLLYILWLSFFGVLKKRKLSKSIFIGSVIAVSFLSYDLLYLDNIIVNNTGFLTNFALLSFILLQAAINFRFTRETELELLMLSEKVKRLSDEVKNRKVELTKLHSESIKQLKIRQEVTNKLSQIHKVENSSFLSEIVAELKSYRVEDERVMLLKGNLQELNYEFVNRLTEKHQNLTKTDIEICSFIRFGFSSSEIANLRFTSKLSVKSSRYRIRKKLSLTENVRLTNYLKEL